ncbi:hypothetical protein F511_30698 [Dorcoceras hygrometricum]|uniref:Uncharacterized protein n=1 Tax=Dorcoceras hygrometricum TaxID=472368 RepID=A0A2Z7BA10_9LAMI|nr:hypothetical protein F511_30698 [Dorcoceras hygrometricum]
MVVDLIGIYGLKGPYRTLTTTNWFLQALSVIPRGSWGDVARRFTMIRWADHCIQFRKLSRSVRSDRRSELGEVSVMEMKRMFIPARLLRKFVSGQFDEENPFVLISSVLLVQADEGVSFLVVDRIGDIYRSLPRRDDVIVTTVGARLKCQQGSGFEPPIKRHFTVGGGRYHQSGPRPETGFLRQPALEGLTISARMDSPHQDWPETIFRRAAAAASDGGGERRRRRVVRLKKRGGGGYDTRYTDSACKNKLVVVSVQYGPFNPYIPIRSTTIGKSRVAIDPIAMRTSWRSNSDIASVTSIGYPRMSGSGESSTTMHRLLHASGSHPIPPPDDPKTNQYNQDLGLIHSTNGNHLESPNDGSSIDHQVTIYLHAQNITIFPTNETWYFASQILVSNSGGLILILMAQSTRNMFRIHSDY